MRFLHTADWHLGRLFHGLHLTDDQAHVLQEFVQVAKDAKPDAIVVAGDVYDRAVPPPEAVELLGDVLARLILDVKAPVILIAGNHDSPKRLGFCARLLAQNNLHVCSVFDGEVTSVKLTDEHGPVMMYAMPYAEPPVVREKLSADEIADHNDAMRAVVETIRARHPEGMRSVVVSHAYVGGCEATESERPLSVGGAGTVDHVCFDDFDFVALGHLHRRQTIGPRDAVHYSGSLMKYSFSESTDVKSIDIVEIDKRGACKLEAVRLLPRRDMRCVKGYLADLLEHPSTDGRRDDYLQVTLLDEGALLDAMGKLREVYPNVLHIERPALEAAGELSGTGGDRRKMSLEDLFGSFYREMVGSELSPEQSSAFTEVAEKVRRREREAFS